MKTLLIGAAIVDLVVHLPHLPKRGEDVETCDQQISIGGCAYNVAKAMQSFAESADMFFPIGDGFYSQLIRRKLAADQFTSLVTVDQSENGYCLCLVEPDGERSFVTVQGIESEIRTAWLANLGQYDRIYLSSYQCLGDNGRRLVTWLKKQTGQLYFAPGPYTKKIAPEVLQQILMLQPILHLNEAECLALAEQSDLHCAMSVLFQQTNRPVIVTLGAKGACYYDGQPHYVVGTPAKVVDTIGAGDAHLGALLALEAKGISLLDALPTANELAAKVVGVTGATLEEEI